MPAPEPALVTALRGSRPGRTPVWFMRQAGRSLPEYRTARAGVAMLDACLDPALAAELTLQPVRRHGVDAAVFFSDIVVPVRQAGVAVEIRAGVGPVLENPVRSAADVAALPAPDPDLAAVAEGVRATVAQLGDTPLLGFAGAPFTLACYLVEGGPSKDHLRTRTLMHAAPEVWSALMAWAADVSGAFLRTQVDAGASAVQLFDSWAGVLSAADYRRFVAPWSARALAGLEVPVVHFAAQGGELLAELRDAAAGAVGETGAVAVGVDHRVPLDEASRRLGGRTPVQGNIDPAMLAAPWPLLAEHVRDVLRRGTAAPGHVVNLGHGVPPDTDPDVLTRIVALVHDLADDVAGDVAVDGAVDVAGDVAVDRAADVAADVAPDDAGDLPVDPARDGDA
ncbi:uroporphyrinogen decarboxylase [Actinotalea sp. M2MS4P-6]|uniref:uroporphyrinogen decarboxylase n=1 Tax=Actinotalea sp. M2MS4P-6 TaxID=2983762 RepID=UPI0021E3AB13|nr:uroporphyrinogen decarboxylase [Actinotalea sp. M2MS4P-6]MCV2392907.1 uroporphyrinogen decarboxylase [Actinotalea sp. M2MS4P-6]